MEQKRKKVRNTHTHTATNWTQSLQPKTNSFWNLSSVARFVLMHRHTHTDTVPEVGYALKVDANYALMPNKVLYFVLLGEFFSAQNLFDCDKKYGKIIFRIRVTYSPDGKASIVVIEYHLMGFWYFAASCVRTLTALTPIWDSIFARNNLNSI